MTAKRNENGTDLLLWALRVFGQDLPSPQLEVRFHPTRRWRFDAAFPGQVAVEIDGGQWTSGGGRHARDSDREKFNEAVIAGWRVLRFSTQQMRDTPAECVDAIRRTLDSGHSL